MCSTCEDRQSTNPNLCGAARAARREEAHRVAQAYDSGKTFAEIGEQIGLGKNTARKLYYEAMEVLNRDKKTELEFMLQQLDAAIDDARRDVDELEGLERVTARNSWLKLNMDKAKLLGLAAPKEAIIKTGPAERPQPSQATLDLYAEFKRKNEK